MAGPVNLGAGNSHVTLVGYKETMQALSEVPMRLRRAEQLTVHIAAKEFKKALKTAYARAAPPPARLTQVKRRLGSGSMPPAPGRPALKHFGTMIRSIRIQRHSRWSAVSIEGKEGYKAVVNETGRSYVRQLTPKARRYLMVLLKHAGMIHKDQSGSSSPLIYVRIPPRPVWIPTFQAFGPELQAIVMRAIRIAFFGMTKTGGSIIRPTITGSSTGSMRLSIPAAMPETRAWLHQLP